jgi:hypothetical protein
MLGLDDLQSGKLVAPLGFVPSPRKLVLWIAPHLDGRADVETLAAWLGAEMRASEVPPPGQRMRPARGGTMPVSVAGGAPARSRRRPA